MEKFDFSAFPTLTTPRLLKHEYMTASKGSPSHG